MRGSCARDLCLLFVEESDFSEAVHISNVFHSFCDGSYLGSTVVTKLNITARPPLMKHPFHPSAQTVSFPPSGCFLSNHINTSAGRAPSILVLRDLPVIKPPSFSVDFVLYSLLDAFATLPICSLAHLVNGRVLRTSKVLDENLLSLTYFSGFD